MYRVVDKEPDALSKLEFVKMTTVGEGHLASRGIPGVLAGRPVIEAAVLFPELEPFLEHSLRRG
jgi:hypothetical protein